MKDIPRKLQTDGEHGTLSSYWFCHVYSLVYLYMSNINEAQEQ
jgi:hypothetical protein